VPRRDPDTIRDIILRVEALNAVGAGGYPLNSLADRFASDQLSSTDAIYWLRHLRDDGYLTANSKSAELITGLTGKGCDFADAVRDPVGWKKTRAASDAAKSWTLDLLKDVAKGLAKQALEVASGVKLPG
jgi:hypothetical protein